MEDVIQDGLIRYHRGALHSFRSFHSGSLEGILAQFVASQAGFEPAALRLTAVCSTSELLRRCEQLRCSMLALALTTSKLFFPPLSSHYRYNIFSVMIYQYINIKCHTF